MKLRSQFVSNSSSASFVIPLSAISARQLEQIVDYPIECESEDSPYVDHWRISVSEHVVSGFTFMSNGDILDFLKSIGVPMDAVHYSE